MDVNRFHQGNRDAWNRTARGGYGSEIGTDVEMLRNGGNSLMEAELRLLGDLTGKCERAIHLQCSHGLDALSLLNLGASEVLGIDISEQMLAYAKAKSDALGANTRWIRSDVLETPYDLDGTADLVYTGKGAICWMMDIDAWAMVVSRLLRVGGRFLLFEGHPLDFVWETEENRFVMRPGGTYFVDAPIPERGFPYDAAVRADPTSTVALTSRVWTIGQVVTALIDVGLRIERLEEYPQPFWDQFKMIPEADLLRLPHTFAVLASKEEDA